MSGNYDILLNKSQILEDELIELLKLREKGKIDFELVDIREPFEYENLRIKGVDKLLPITRFQADMDKWKELIYNKKFIIYCRTGNRTSYLQRFLKEKYNIEVPHLTYGIIDYSGKVESG